MVSASTTLPHDADITRSPDLRAWLAKKSHFLLGPRPTGKTFLVRLQLPDARVYDLLDSEVFLTRGVDVIHAEPFEALDVDLTWLWDEPSPDARG